MNPIIGSCVKWWYGIPLSETAGIVFAVSPQMDVSGQAIETFIRFDQNCLDDFFFNKNKSYN